MKSISLLLVVIAPMTISLDAQTDSSLVGASDTSPERFQFVAVAGKGAYVITEAGPHVRRWAREVEVRQEDGSIQTQTQTYIEIASGLNRMDENQRWVPADSNFELVNGSAVAQYTAHKVILTSPTDRLPVDLLMPDGRRLSSRVLGIAYATDSGRSTLIAEPKETAGLMHGSQVIYENCFDGGFRCDLRYTLTLAGLEQDLVLKEVPPPPTEFGFAADEPVHIQLVTEFLEAPEPQVREFAIRGQKDFAKREQAPDLGPKDQDIVFGGMGIGPGRAFDLGEARPFAGPPVLKTWNVIEGRKVLFEELSLDAAAPLLNKLPARAQAKANFRTNSKIATTRQEFVMSLKAKPFVARSMQVALAKPAFKDGLVMDYSIMHNMTNVTFESGNTYYVTNMVSLSGTTTIMGGAVIKAGPWNPDWRRIRVLGPVVCKTSSYNPAIATARDDDNFGETLADSQHSISGFYFPWFDFPSTPPGTFSNIRVLHSIYGTTMWYGHNHSITDVQFVDCDTGIEAGSATVFVHNVLMHNVNNALSIYDGTTLTAQHLTVDVTDTFNSINGDSSNHFYFTNCLVAQVTYTNAFAGSNNAILASNSGVFETVGSGSHYLPSASPYNAAGSTNVNGTLLAALRNKTTAAPLVLSNDFSVPTVLSPRAQRGTGVPSIGFYYDPLDYCLSGLNVSNATLLLTNGVAIGVYGTRGLTLQSGASLVSEGKPEILNRLVRYSNVQEQPSVWGATSSTMDLIGVATPLSTLPSIDLRLTHVAAFAPTAATRYFFNSTSSNKVASFAMKDCQLQNVGLQIAPVWDSRSSVVGLTNNLFEYCGTSFTQGASDGSPLSVYLRNNLFTRGSVAFLNSSNVTSWGFYENLWDNPSSSFSSNIPNGTNAYYNISAISGSSGEDITLTNTPDYLPGALGSYYYPDNGANLSRLIDAGGRTAGTAGLFHHTTHPDQAKEESSMVDVGFHYLSLVPAPGLVGLWRMNEGSGSTVADSSGTGNTGTLTNGVTWTIGPPTRDGTAELGGVSGYINLGDPANGSLDFGTNSFSYGMWVYVYHDVGSYDMAWYKGGASDTDPGYDIELGSGAWVTEVVDANNFLYPGIPGGIYTEWVHFFVVVDRAAAAVNLYINGVLRDTVNISGSIASVSNTKAAVIGRSTYPLDARIDDVRVYNRALTPVEVAGFTTGTPRDLDGDSLPDYVEDRNGSGTVDGSETDWTASDSGISGAAALQVFTPLR